MYKHKPYRGSRYERNRKIRRVLLVIAVVFAVLFSIGVFQDLPFLHRSGDQTIANNAQADGKQSEDEIPVGAHTIYLPASSLNESTVQQLIRMHETGLINGIITDLKNQDGTLNYPSQISYLSGNSVTTQAASTLPGLIKSLRDAGLSVAGRIYCYHDNTFAHINKDATICTKNNYTWLDSHSKRHLNPYSDTSADYLSQIIEEAGGLGCTEVILDDFSFPDNGQTQYISYGQQELTKSQILTQRLQQFVQKGQELGMEVSLYLSNPTDNNGLNETLGTDTASFYEVVSHLYVPLSVQNKEGEAQLKQSVSALTQDADKLIPIYNDPQVFSTRFTQDGSTDFYCFDTVNNGYSLNGFYTD